MSKHSYRTSVAPTQDQPQFYPSYQYRGGSSHRPSSAGTSRSRSQQSRNSSGTTNIYVANSNPQNIASSNAGVFGQQIPSANNRPQSAGAYRSSNNSNSSSISNNQSNQGSYSQSNSNTNRGPVTLGAGYAYPTSAPITQGSNPTSLPNPNSSSNSSNNPSNSSSNILYSYYSNRPKSAGSSRTASSNPASGNVQAASNNSNQSSIHIPSLPATAGATSNNNTNWKTSFKLHYGSNPADNSLPNPNATSDSSQTPFKTPIETTMPSFGTVSVNSTVQASTVNSSATPSAPLQPPPPASSSRPSSASSRIRTAINESQKYGNASGTNVAGSASQNAVVTSKTNADGIIDDDEDGSDFLAGEGGLVDPGLGGGKLGDALGEEGTSMEDFLDHDESEGGRIGSRSQHPEVSIGTATANSNRFSGSTDLRHSSVDSYGLSTQGHSHLTSASGSELDGEIVEIGLSTVPNNFCSIKDAVELRKLIQMTSHARGGIVPSSSAVMDMYMVGKVIGVGSYGKVRVAWHRLTGAKVAIKTYDKAKLKDPSHWKRVYSEIKIMEQISHPRIARMYEAVETPKRMHLILECLDGGNLCTYVKQKKRLTEEESRRIFFQLLQSIDYLHSLGVSHRDIKLENVLFMDNGKDIKIIDFGFSTVCQPGKKLKVFCGTPSYMAPEIVRRLEYEGKPVDMWSMGILLYALLCGCFPFRAKTYPDLYRRIARGSFTIPEELSAAVKDLLKNLLQVDPMIRWTSSQALKHSWLQSVSNHGPDLDKLRRETAILISDRPVEDLDEETLREIEVYGLVKDDVVKTVLTKTHSATATLYYLLLDICRLRRKKGEKVSGSGGMNNNASMTANYSYQNQNAPYYVSNTANGSTSGLRKSNRPSSAAPASSAAGTFNTSSNNNSNSNTSNSNNNSNGSNNGTMNTYAYNPMYVLQYGAANGNGNPVYGTAGITGQQQPARPRSASTTRSAPNNASNGFNGNYYGGAVPNAAPSYLYQNAQQTQPQTQPSSQPQQQQPVASSFTARPLSAYAGRRS